MYYHILTCSFFFISRKSRSRLCYICYFDPPTRLYVIPTVRRFVFVWIGSEWRGADAGVGGKTRGRRRFFLQIWHLLRASDPRLRWVKQLEVLLGIFVPCPYQVHTVP